MKISENSFIRWAVDRPVTVRMVLLAVVVVGFLVYQRIPLQQLPSGFTPRFLTIRVPYRSTSPEEVERAIVLPVEEAIGTLSGIEELRSHAMENGARFVLRFAGGTDMDAAYVQVVDRMELAMVRLPNDVQRYWIRKFNLADRPILWMAASSVSGKESGLLRERAYDIQNHVLRRLERVPGVAKVEGGGLTRKRYEIVFNLGALRRHRINLYTLLNRLEKENLDLSIGEVFRGGRRHYLRSIGRFASLPEVERFPVSPGVPLTAVATLREVHVHERNVARVDGFTATTFAVYKEGDANTVETAAAVRKVITLDLPEHPALAGLRFHVLWDQGESIRWSMEQLEETAAFGGALAILVLFVFLRRIGMTAIISFAIPFSLVLTLIVLYFQGESLNMISLMGLTLGVGMLVDNSVVVSESIERVRDRKEGDSRSAALQGTSEVALAVLIATSTTLVVFVPLMLMGEHDFQFFMMRLGLPICYALIASLGTALILIPFAASRLPDPCRSSGAVRGGIWALFDRGVERFLSALQGIYLSTLGWMLRRRADALLILLLPALLGMFWLSGQLNWTDENQGEDRDFILSVRFPDSYDISDASHAMAMAERALLEKVSKKRLEIDRVFCQFDDRRGRLWVFLTPGEKAVRPRSEILPEVEEKLPKMKDVDFQVGWRSGRGEDDSKVPIVLEGRDTQRLVALAEDVQRLIGGLPGVVGIETDIESGYEEVHVHIDRQAAERVGVDPRNAMGTLVYTLRGRNLPELQMGDEEIDLLARFEEEAPLTVADLRDLRVFTRNGGTVPLGTFADFRPSRGMGGIQRVNGMTRVTVLATTTSEDLDKLSASIDARLAGLSLPEGYRWVFSGRFEKMAENMGAYKFAMVMAVVFVFLLMGVLFESIVLPFAVLVTIPFGFLGVYAILVLTGTAMGIMSLIGVVILVGIVVNNGVVLVDRINRLRRSGETRTAAILGAGAARLRPILMTALTTIVGLIPMAFGASGTSGIPYFPIARTVIGGLTASTLFTLFLVPLVFTLLEDLGQEIRRLVNRFLAAGSREVA